MLLVSDVLKGLEVSWTMETSSKVVTGNDHQCSDCIAASAASQSPTELTLVNELEMGYDRKWVLATDFNGDFMH